MKNPILVQPDLLSMPNDLNSYTLRDYFASLAMSGIFASGQAEPEKQEHFDNIAMDSYRIADAMLKQRQNQTK